MVPQARCCSLPHLGGWWPHCDLRGCRNCRCGRPSHPPRPRARRDVRFAQAHPPNPWAILFTHRPTDCFAIVYRRDAPFSQVAMASNLPRPPNIAKTVRYLRLADGSGTTLVEQVRPAFGWRCRCSLFRSREARNGTSFDVEHLRDLVCSSRSSEQ
jgi:hypothetical protein